MHSTKNICLGFLLFLCSCSLMQRNEETPSTLRREVKETPGSKVSNGPRKRVALLPFLDANSSRPSEFMTLSRQSLIDDLNRGGELMALPSEEFKLDLSQKTKDGHYDMQALARQARNQGLSALLEGKLIQIRVDTESPTIGIIRRMKTGIEVDIQVRVASLRGGKEVFNTIKTVRLEDETVRFAEKVDTDKFVEANPDLVKIMIKDAFLEFKNQIIGSLGRLDWEGRVAAVQGERIYLNVGKISGLQVGDLLKVSEDGDDIYDPDSGQFIGRGPGRMKGTLEVVSFFGNDGSIAVIHSGAGFKENDKVEMY